MNVARYLASALLLALLSGCATYPISKEFRQQAKEVTFDQVRANPESTRGTIVIWGGRIINVVNDTNGSSIYILCLPIRSNEKPIAYGPSPGRFIATSTGFLDPEMFPQGSRVTVAGQLGGVWTEPLGKVQYAYPVVDIQETHVWPRQQEESYGYPYYGYYGPGWGWDWGWGGVPVYYGGFYHGFHGGFHGNFHGGGDFHGEAESRGGGGGGEGGGFHGGGGAGHGR